MLAMKGLKKGRRLHFDSPLRAVLVCECKANVSPCKSRGLQRCEQKHDCRVGDTPLSCVNISTLTREDFRSDFMPVDFPVVSTAPVSDSCLGERPAPHGHA